jgi:hypothetical protein
MLLLYPGLKTPALTLQAILRERHEHALASEQRDVERRRAAGVPITDAVDWPAVQRAASAGDARAVFDLVSKAQEPQLGAYEPKEGYDAVTVVLVAISDATRARLLMEVALASEGRTAAATATLTRESASAVLAADQAVTAAMLAFLQATVDKLVVGGRDVDLASPKAHDALASTGALLTHLFVAARDYQTLPPGKEPRFG